CQLSPLEMSSAEQNSTSSLLNKFEKLSWRPSIRDSGQFVPPARSGHRCVADNTNLYVFGGYNPDFEEAGGSENEDYPLFRELWRFHFATGTWQQVRTEGYMPTELASMSAVMHGNNLLVFGGTGIPFGENNGNDVHVCNVHYKRWNLLNCRGKKPNKIYGQAMIIVNGYLYVFGGTTGYLYSTDLHRLDLSTREWTHLKPNNTPSDLPEERLKLSNIHAYNLETNYWEEIATKPHDKIGIHYCLVSYCSPMSQLCSEVFICGGYNGEMILSDLWKINLQTFEWTKLPALMPEPAYFHCAAVTPAGCMYIHGGVINMSGNRRTSSLYKLWLVVPSLLEVTWEKLLKTFPHLAQLSTLQLLSLGLTHTLIQRLK
uniref:Kelch domain-containing protein 10 n=1 Tax=Periophthalmus magnuspinnatus TaxID=409849 RepID=A0A3B4BH81_9GOBI